MSHALVTWALRQRVGSGPRKAVLLYLTERHNGKTGRCDPLVSTIAAELEIGERTVSRELAELEAEGFIARSRKHRRNGTNAGWDYAFPRYAPDGDQPATQADPTRHTGGYQPATQAAHEPEERTGRRTGKVKRAEVEPAWGGSTSTHDQEHDQEELIEALDYLRGVVEECDGSVDEGTTAVWWVTARELSAEAVERIADEISGRCGTLGNAAAYATACLRDEGREGKWGRDGTREGVWT